MKDLAEIAGMFLFFCGSYFAAILVLAMIGVGSTGVMP